jgi:hypothetical protein
VRLDRPRSATRTSKSHGEPDDDGKARDVMDTYIDQKVLFILSASEQFVVPRRGRGYVRVDGITVSFPHGREPQVWAGGIICRKDGEPGRGWGKTSTSVDLPDVEPWIERARDEVGLTENWIDG